MCKKETSVIIGETENIIANLLWWPKDCTSTKHGSIKDISSENLNQRMAITILNGIAS